MPTFESAAAGAATETGTTLPAPYPATVNSGDLLYLYAWRKTNADQHTFTTPDGWTELTTAATANGGRHSLWHRTADGTETGDVSITTSADLSGGQGGRAFMARVSDTAGHDTGVYSFAGQANTPEMVIATGITPSEDNCLVLTGVGIATTSPTVPNLTPPAGYTERLDVGTGWITTLGLGTLLQTTATATGALTWDTDAQNVTSAGGGFIVSALPAETGETTRHTSEIQQLTRGIGPTRAAGLEGDLQ